MPKNRVKGWVMGHSQSGGMEAVWWLLAKQQVWGPQPPPPRACFMQIPASESLFFLFSLTEGANSGWIWRTGQNCVLVTELAWSVGMVYAFVLSLVRQRRCSVME